MNIIDRLATRLGYIKTEELKNPPGHLLAHAGSQKFELPDGSLYKNQSDLYRRLSWVNIAISIVAQSCAVTPFEVKQLKGEDEDSIENHPFELLLRKPNPLQSRFEFLEATAAFKCLTGNAYWWLNRNSNDDEPSEMWVIPPYQMTPVPDENLYLKGYMYDPGDGSEWPIPLHEVVHFKGFNPLSNFIGLSKVEAIATIAIGDMAMQKWNTQAFGQNNARLPGILAFADPIPDADWFKMIQEVDDAAKKRNIMMMRNVNPEGVQWIQATLSQKEMEFLAGREFNKEEIFGIFAPGLASMLDVNATEANAKTGKMTFADYTLWPMMVAMGEKVTNDLLGAYGENQIGGFEDIRVTDKAMELSEQEAAAKVQTINEMRQTYYQLDPLPDDDERGMMFVAQIGASPVSVDKEEEVTPPGEMPIPAPDIFQPRPIESTEPVEKGQEVDNEEAIKGELGQWQRWAMGRVKANKDLLQPFNTEYIPLEMKAEIMSMLADAKTANDVTAVFNAIKTEHANDYGGFDNLISALSEATQALREKGTE